MNQTLWNYSQKLASKRILNLSSPETLVLNQLYFLQSDDSYQQPACFLPVVFVGFDTIPAFIFVRDSQGFVWRCLREDLYTIHNSIE